MRSGQLCEMEHDLTEKRRRASRTDSPAARASSCAGMNPRSAVGCRGARGSRSQLKFRGAANGSDKLTVLQAETCSALDDLHFIPNFVIY